MPSPSDVPTGPPPICTDGNVQKKNMLQSIGNSLIDITGLGQLIDRKTPLQKLQSEIQQIKEKTQEAINTGMTSYAKFQNDLDKEMINDINLVNQSLQSYVSLQDEIIYGKIALNEIYIFGSYFLLLVTIIFILISNAFNKVK